jgi:hypothetical protein
MWEKCLFCHFGKESIHNIWNSERKFGFGDLSWYDGYYGKTQKEIESILKTGKPISTFCFSTPFPSPPPPSNGG